MHRAAVSTKNLQVQAIIALCWEHYLILRQGVVQDAPLPSSPPALQHSQRVQSAVHRVQVWKQALQ